MILNEPTDVPASAPPTTEAWLVEPGPVWYTPPAAKSGRRNGAARPARLVRSVDDTAWIALLQPDGRWKRQQARHARLAPRTEVLELDHAWVAVQETNGGTLTNGVRAVPGGAANGTPARAQSSPTSPRAGLSIAAEPRWIRARDAALQCPDCGATSGRRGTKFRSFRDLRHHQTMAHPEHYPFIKPRAPQPKKYRPRTAPARPPSDASDSLQCPDCGATSGRTGRKFHRIRDLLRHQDVAHRLPDPAAGPIECPDCGATGSRRGKKFRDRRDLVQHRVAAHRAPDPAAGPLECPDCGATSSKRGQNFRDSGHLAQHRKRCARRAAKAAPPAEAPAPEVHQNSRASALAAAPANGSAAQPSPAQAVRFCAGCGLNLEAIPIPVRFCPACGLGTAAIHAALGTQLR